MKKRILAIMLMLPLLVAFIAMGFTKLVSIVVPQLPEFIDFDYSENQAFEFNEIGDSMELRAFIYPESAAGEIIWTSSNEDIAKIEGNVLTFVSEERESVTITASVKNTFITKSFKARLMQSGDIPKYIGYNYVYSCENGENTVALYDYADPLSGAETKAHTEEIEFNVYPLRSPQDVTVTVSPECPLSTTIAADMNGISKVSVTPDQTGEYTVTVASKTNPEIFADIKFNVVDGVNVYSYEDIVRATDYSAAHPTPFALRVNLESSSNLGRSNSKPMAYASGAPHHKYYSEESTYDVQYLKNSGKSTDVLAILVFRSDVYGNGHTINLHDLAYPTETNSSGLAIPGIKDDFAGEPLPFVSAAGLAVFGQGNRGFLIKGDNITLDNIVLKNCNNVDNLSNLDYVGTVLEVEGNNVTIQNSTVQNGRTVVRSMSNQNLLIKNCLLAYAREFIFKQGSNTFEYPTPSANSDWNTTIRDQLFDKDSELVKKATAECDSTATIEDTDFYTSGIFCIGMDTHFAGQYLYKWSNSSSIHDMAATSHKSVLHLNKNVKFYDWKIIKNMNSSTLVSGMGEKFSLNINDMLQKYKNVYPDSQVIKTVNGTDYAHGGIAFFGGGNNLSEVYFDGKSVKAVEAGGGLNDEMFESLSISLSSKNNPLVEQSELIGRAAGEGPFYFCLYRNTYEGIGINDVPSRYKA